MKTVLFYIGTECIAIDAVTEVEKSALKEIENSITEETTMDEIETAVINAELYSVRGLSENETELQLVGSRPRTIKH